MKKTIRKALAIVLTLVMLSGTFTAFAVELNQEAANAHYGQYKNYVLLGDSAASGYRDVKSENDTIFNRTYKESAFYRVPGSYGDIIANAIIEDKSMTACAGPGFRTIEIRYMLEDDYAATCEDQFLFYPSNVHSQGDPKTKREMYKKAVAEADLITLGVGGNDWGAYIGWVVIQTLIDAGIYDEILATINEIMAGATLDMAMVSRILDIVSSNPEAFAAVVEKLPAALEYGLTTFYENWDIMIEDIYAYNPDVTLMVVGMSDNGVKGHYFDYNGVPGEPVTGSVIGGADSGEVSAYIVDFIMTIGNTPMIEGAKKYGYTYVDTTGTTYVESHPDAAGHAHIANKILEALPDKEVSNKFDDMKPGNKYYASVDYLVSNGYMTGLTETSFGPDEAITSGQLNAAVNAITGANGLTVNTAKAKMLEVALAMLTGGAKKGFVAFFKGIGLMMRVMTDYSFNVGAEITRGEAAVYLAELAKL